MNRLRCLSEGLTITVNGIEKPWGCVRPWANNCTGCRKSYYPDRLEDADGNNIHQRNRETLELYQAMDGQLPGLWQKLLS